MRSETKYLLGLGIILLGVIGLIAFSYDESTNEPTGALKKFNSYDELKQYIQEQRDDRGFYGTLERAVSPGMKSSASAGAVAPATATQDSAEAGDYSQTNVQVEGVDEADFVKNDGKYIYSIVGNNVVIVDAFPASQMKILKEFEVNGSVRDLFVNDDRLIVFADRWEEVIVNSAEGTGDDSVVHAVGDAGANAKMAADIAIYPPRQTRSMTAVYIYDISDRGNPSLENEILMGGNYQNARMISDYIYFISSQYVYDSPILPMYRINGAEKTILANDIYYFDYPDSGYSFSTIGAINIESGEFSNKVYLTGNTGTLFVSENNVYITGLKSISAKEYAEKSVREVFLPVLPSEEKSEALSILESDMPMQEKLDEINSLVETYSDSLRGDEKADFDAKLKKSLEDFEKSLRKDREMTVIHKIGINGMDIQYKGKGLVHGSVLNQFSMDEHQGYFRIATTLGNMWEGDSINNIYVLNEDMDIVGKLENLAPGEKIYSARFMGDRVYLVTFKKIDPFYVIDLSDVDSPQVLGYLKIPGYSDYLHPYDKNHIIGIGKEAIDASDDEIGNRGLDFAWYQGLKITIFDVSDVANPKETAKIVVGDRGTDSTALYDHKAFLFDKKRNLLVLPISLAEIDENDYAGGAVPANAYGEMVWQGAYVFDIRENSITVRGKVSHHDELKKLSHAADEPLGAERKDVEGNVWTKVEVGKWKILEKDLHGEWIQDAYTRYPTGNKGYEGVIYGDYSIDSFPGGVLYSPLYDYGTQIQRSLFMDDVLYTLSMQKIKAHDLSDLEEVGNVDLPFEEIYYGGVLY